MSNLSFEMRKLKKITEEKAAAQKKEMEEKKIELQELHKEMEELEQTISKQEAEMRRLSAVEEKLEKEESASQGEMAQYFKMKSWTERIFDRVTVGPHQERFSKIKDPIEQLEVILDVLRLAKAEKTDKAKTNPQQG